MQRDSRLTVCTVSFHNARHIRLNYELTGALNRDPGRFQWIVAENTPEGNRYRLEFSNPRLRVIPGAAPNTKANFHHAEALNKTVELVTTRFLLVLDPDFYVIRANWWDDVLEHMNDRGLGIFGAPWHPRYTDKFRYFPTVHCTFFDLARISLRDLDFRPLSGEASTPRGQDDGSSLIAAAWARLSLQHRRRKPVDSGTRMYLRYAKDPMVKSECLVPVYRLPQELSGATPLPWRSRAIEWLLPDELCYMPKRWGYFTHRGLRECGFDAPIPEDWEEFMWRGEPFGFHMRRNNKKQVRDEETELVTLNKVLQTVIADSDWSAAGTAKR